ncbi:MAG: hypothetical protein WD623_10405 [Marinobacter sp.]|uniref:hypothetical protein n=1 Tax=Marinobacter sp. TaxID=50741 RepID=UPI0034A098B6
MLAALVAVIVALLAVKNEHDNVEASGGSKKAQRVVQCLYEDGFPFLGEIENTFYDEKRSCYAMMYQISGSIGYPLVPSYGRARESLYINLPEGSEISNKLNQLYGVRSEVKVQISPSDFDAQLRVKTELAAEHGQVESFVDDERFLVRKIGDDSRRYYSKQEGNPLQISCSMEDPNSNDFPEHSICYVWTKTCNKLTLKYTIFGNPFDKLDAIDRIHQRVVQPLFERCD